MATQIFSYIPDLEQMKDPTLDDVTSQNHEIHSNSVNIELEKGDLEHETKREEFLKELRAYDPILTDIKKLESVRDEIANTIDEIERVFAEDKKKEIVRRMENSLKIARNTAKSLKQRLTDIKARNESLNSKVYEDGSVKVEIRNNMFNYYMRKLFKAQKDYTAYASETQKILRDRKKRDLMFIGGETLTDAEADRLIDLKLDQQWIQGKMEGEEQQLERLIAQQNAVQSIQNEVREVLEMFQDMAAMVDAQQETIDNITSHVAGTKEYTGNAAVELHKAWEYQLSARRKMCCCATIVLIVIAAIIIIILAAAGVFDQKNNDNNNNNNN